MSAPVYDPTAPTALGPSQSSDVDSIVLTAIARLKQEKPKATKTLPHNLEPIKDVAEVLDNSIGKSAMPDKLKDVIQRMKTVGDGMGGEGINRYDGFIDELTAVLENKGGRRRRRRGKATKKPKRKARRYTRRR
jgi:hypothetical protein